jgi:hypothetical protein
VGIFGGPSAEKILAKGTATSGRIVGLDVHYTHDDAADNRLEDYAIELSTGETIGIRQRLNPDDVVRIGMPIRAVVLDGAGVVDWAATGAEQGFAGRSEVSKHKALKDPPAPGLVDSEDGLASARKKGEPISLTFTSIDDRSILFGLATAVDVTATVRLEGMEPYEGVIRKVQVPFYASHLLREGVTLPGFVKTRRLDRPYVDWPAATLAEPGLGVPPARSKPAPEPEQVSSMGEGVDARSAIDDAASRGDLHGGIDLHTYVGLELDLLADRVPPKEYQQYAAQRGVADWDAADRAWKDAMKDWRVGAAHGEAFEAERKARKKR